MLQFMQKQSEVLEQNGAAYPLADANDKKLQERFRKRLAKLLRGRDEDKVSFVPPFFCLPS